jgi:hypothetical protein
MRLAHLRSLLIEPLYSVVASVHAKVDVDTWLRARALSPRSDHATLFRLGQYCRYSASRCCIHR